jgi:hypothetical protein
MMERPKVLRVRIGYNPNSSAHSAYFSAILFATWLSLPITLFTSFIFADILFRKVSKERKVFPRIVFVLIPLAFVTIFLVFHNILPPLLFISFPSVSTGLLTLSLILFIFTSLRIPAIMSGFFLIVGNFLTFYFGISDLWYLVNLPVSYITGFFIGHLIAKRRKDESSV